MNFQAGEREKATSWRVAGIEGLECFRAWAITHHYGRHSHEGYAIGVIEAGVGGNHCRGSLHYFPAGRLVVMNPDEAHTGFAAGTQPLTYRMFYLSPAAFQEMLPERALLPHFREISLDDSYWAGQLRALHRLLETGGDYLEQQTRFIETFTAFAAAYGHSAGPEAATCEPQAIRQVKAFLQAHYQRNV